MFNFLFLLNLILLEIFKYCLGFENLVLMFMIFKYRNGLYKSVMLFNKVLFSR